MKLKTFNLETTPQLPRGTGINPSLSINQKTGLFNINKPACDLIGLSEGDQLSFSQDEENEDDWYLEKVKEKGFSLRYKKDFSSGVFFNNTTLARIIFKSVGYTDNSGRLLIAGQATKSGKQTFYGLLTESLKNKI